MLGQINLLEFFLEGLSVFFRKETDNLLFGTNERNLCGRLSIYLEQLLEKYELQGYYVDTEYNRKQGGQVKTIIDDQENIININADLIVHSRGEIMTNDNLICLEMKKSNRSEEDKSNDRKRLKAMTKSSYDGVWSYDGKTHPEHVCGYSLGIYLEFDINKRVFILERYIKGKIIHRVNSIF